MKPSKKKEEEEVQDTRVTLQIGRFNYIIERVINDQAPTIKDAYMKCSCSIYYEASYNTIN